MNDTATDTGILAAETAVESDGLRVVRLTLAPGGTVPWHWHSVIADRFVCLTGDIEVEQRAPRARYRLAPGEECMVPARTAHIVRNLGPGEARFMVIQGVGKYDLNLVGGT